MEYKLPFKKYSEALKSNKLLGLKCKACGAITVPPKMACRQCASPDMDVIELNGTGKVQTFTSAYVSAEGREAEVPYVLVMVELDEGPWIMGNLTGVEPSEVTIDIIGERVQMGHKVFSGDKYSAGESASPLFSLTT